MHAKVLRALSPLLDTENIVVKVPNAADRRAMFEEANNYTNAHFQNMLCCGWSGHTRTAICEKELAHQDIQMATKSWNCEFVMFAFGWFLNHFLFFFKGEDNTHLMVFGSAEENKTSVWKYVEEFLAIPTLRRIREQN